MILFSPSLSFFWMWLLIDLLMTSFVFYWPGDLGEKEKVQDSWEKRENEAESKMELLKNFGTVEILQPNGSLPEFSYEHLYSLIKGRTGQAYCLWWYTWATFRSLNRVNTVSFLQGPFHEILRKCLMIHQMFCCIPNHSCLGVGIHISPSQKTESDWFVLR